MLVNKGTKMHYLFFSSQCPALVLPASLRSKTSFQFLCERLCPTDEVTPTSVFELANVTFPPFASDNNPPPTSAFVHSGSSLCRNLLQSHADSCFLYQNIDLFSLYTTTVAPLAWSVFLLFSPLPRAPLLGRRFLVFNLPAKRSLAARGTVVIQGSILGILVPNWQCWPLCREGGREQLSEWSSSK